MSEQNKILEEHTLSGLLTHNGLSISIAYLTATLLAAAGETKAMLENLRGWLVLDVS